MPVVGSRAGTGPPPIETAGVVTDMLTVPVGPTVAGLPFSVSPFSASTTSAPPVRPFTPVTLSASATIAAALTITVIVAGSQFVAFRTSQIS